MRPVDNLLGFQRSAVACDQFCLTFARISFVVIAAAAAVVQSRQHRRQPAGRPTDRPRGRGTTTTAAAAAEVLCFGRIPGQPSALLLPPRAPYVARLPASHTNYCYGRPERLCRRRRHGPSLPKIYTFVLPTGRLPHIFIPCTLRV